MPNVSVRLATPRATAEKTAEAATDEETAENSEEDKSEEDMWAEAFADQEATEETAEAAPAEETTEEDEAEDDEDEEGEAEDDEDEDEEGEAEHDEDEQDAAAELGISEDDYPEDDDEDEDARIKIGPISVPATRTGKLMLAGGVLGLLVTAGGAYFAWQTFAPPELTEVAKPEAEVPEGMTPKPDKEEASAAPEEKPPEEKSEKTETKSQEPEKVDQPKILGESSEDKNTDIAKELAKSKTLSEVTESTEDAKEESAALRAALSPEAKLVKLSTIMPVAFDVNDIRVLSFTLAITFTDEDSAKVMQTALPLFEETTVITIEKFLAKKFYNDILYVKEKLEKRLQIAYNKRIDSDGRVKKIKFEDFVIQ